MIKLKSNAQAITTPNNAECAIVSPKYDNLLQTIKHPNGPVINARPMPAANALKIKKPTPIHRMTFKPLKNKY